MAASTNPSRIGQANLAGDERALFLKVFSGMVMNTFEKELKTRSRHTIRSIANGKSAQFPVMGRAQADYHQVGENILDPTNGLLSNIEHAEKVINIDDKLLSAVAISDVDEAINHYDIRATYARRSWLCSCRALRQSCTQGGLRSSSFSSYPHP